MADARFRLGCDFGTSHTVAVLAWPDGHTRPLLFDGSPLLPSMVCWDPELGLLAGADAAHTARTRPERVEPHPKRCVDDGTVLLDEVEVPVERLVAAVLRRVLDEATRVTAGEVPAVVLTHPAGWGPARRSTLRAAAALAGLPRVGLAPEPTAAAAYFLRTGGARVPPGTCAVVYDFGAGTFDASVVRRQRDRVEVLATEGLADVGGLDVDAAIVAHLAAVYAARDASAWQRITDPATSARATRSAGREAPAAAGAGDGGARSASTRNAAGSGGRSAPAGSVGRVRDRGAGAARGCPDRAGARRRWWRWPGRVTPAHHLTGGQPAAVRLAERRPARPGRAAGGRPDGGRDHVRPERRPARRR